MIGVGAETGSHSQSLIRELMIKSMRLMLSKPRSVSNTKLTHVGIYPFTLTVTIAAIQFI